MLFVQTISLRIHGSHETSKRSSNHKTLMKPQSPYLSTRKAQKGHCACPRLSGARSKRASPIASSPIAWRCIFFRACNHKPGNPAHNSEAKRCNLGCTLSLGSSSRCRKPVAGSFLGRPEASGGARAELEPLQTADSLSRFCRFWRLNIWEQSGWQSVFHPARSRPGCFAALTKSCRPANFDT